MMQKAGKDIPATPQMEQTGHAQPARRQRLLSTDRRAKDCSGIGPLSPGSMCFIGDDELPDGKRSQQVSSRRTEVCSSSGLSHSSSDLLNPSILESRASNKRKRADDDMGGPVKRTIQKPVQDTTAEKSKANSAATLQSCGVLEDTDMISYGGNQHLHMVKNPYWYRLSQRKYIVRPEGVGWTITEYLRGHSLEEDRCINLQSQSKHLSQWRASHCTFSETSFISAGGRRQVVIVEITSVAKKETVAMFRTLFDRLVTKS